jgi:hypothetical protein
MAETAFREGRYEDAAALHAGAQGACAEEAHRARPQCATEALRRWDRAQAQLRLAEAHRRGRRFADALAAVEQVLRPAVFPRSKAALAERGKTLLDAGKPAVAVGLGRIVALHYRSSMLHQIRYIEENRYLFLKRRSDQNPRSP